MINEVVDFQPAELHSVAQLEQDLLFVGIHSTTGILRVQFIQDEKQVEVEIRGPALRTKMLSDLIDGIGNALKLAREKEGLA